MKYQTSIVDGLKITSTSRLDIQLVEIDGSVNLRAKQNDEWIYPEWAPKFKTISAAETWMNENISPKECCISQSDLNYIMNMYGFTLKQDAGHCQKWQKTIRYVNQDRYIDFILNRCIDSSVILSVFENDEIAEQFCCITNSDSLVSLVDTLFDKYRINPFTIMLSYKIYRNNVIKCAKSNRDLTKNMVRVKSSNVWSYNINIRNHGDKVGDVVVQFKDSHGGPGDIYIYYDVPITLYRKWITAPSKGHFFWVYIRNNFKYSKLTGDKRGKLRNAVN